MTLSHSHSRQLAQLNWNYLSKAPLDLPLNMLLKRRRERGGREYVWVYMCVCVCVRERESECDLKGHQLMSERATDLLIYTKYLCHTHSKHWTEKPLKFRNVGSEYNNFKSFMFFSWLNKQIMTFFQNNGCSIWRRRK